MEVRRRLLAVAVAVAALTATALVVPLPASAVTDTTVLEMVGDPGDPIVGPNHYTVSPPGTELRAQGTTAGVHLSAVQPGPGHFWFLDFAAPPGTDLTAGLTYPNAERFPGPGVAALDVTGDGSACNTVAGSFTVLEIAIDAFSGVVQQFAASFEQHCGGVAPAVRGVVYFHSTLTPASISNLSLTGDTSKVPGGVVALQGVLTAGGSPVVGADVTLSRTDGSGTTSLPPVTTGTDGSYTAPDTMGTTAATYTASFAGDASRTASRASVHVAVAKFPSTLAVVAPATGKRGVTYTVSGVLSTRGTPVAGAKISLRRTDLAGTKALTLTTNAAGGYAYRDVPPVGGNVAWTASWAGDATNAATSASRTVVIARTRTSMVVTTSASRYAYGARATVTVRLGTTYNRRDVYVYARPLGTSVVAPGTLVAHVKVNVAGVAAVSYVMRRSTTFTVAFRGDYRYAPVARVVTRAVVPRVTVTLSGWSVFTGGFYVFHNVSPRVHVVVTPSVPGACIGLQEGFYAGNTWQHGNTAGCLYLDANSTVDGVVTHTAPAGNRFFVIANVSSTPSTAAGASAPLYFRFG